MLIGWPVLRTTEYVRLSAVCSQWAFFHTIFFLPQRASLFTAIIVSQRCCCCVLESREVLDTAIAMHTCTLCIVGPAALKLLVLFFRAQGCLGYPMVAQGSVTDSLGSTATTLGGSAMEKSDQDFPETHTFMTKNSVLLPGYPAPNYGAHQNQSQVLTACARIRVFLGRGEIWTDFRLLLYIPYLMHTVLGRRYTHYIRILCGTASALWCPNGNERRFVVAEDDLDFVVWFGQKTCICCVKSQPEPRNT